MATANLEADKLLWIAQGLSTAGGDEDSLWLRKRIGERRAAGAVRNS